MKPVAPSNSRVRLLDVVGFQFGAGTVHAIAKAFRPKPQNHRSCAISTLSVFRRPEGVIVFPINAPGMGRFKLFNLVGYS